ncbi:MAG: hypothetical protein ABEK50_07710 [bacterium]
MTFKHRSITLIAFLVASIALLSGPVSAAEPVQELVQMPVAVDNAAEAGIPETELNRITQALNEGEASPDVFNETLSKTPDLAAKVGSITSVGDFVVASVNDGLRGEELASAIHERLRQEGIPAGGEDVAGPPPIAKEFMPADARKKVESVMPEQRDSETMRKRQQRDVRDRRQQRPSEAAGAGASPGEAGTASGSRPAPSNPGR